MLEVEAMGDQTAFYIVKRKRKAFVFESSDMEAFEQLGLQSSR